MFFCFPSIVIFQKYCIKLNASILLGTTQTSLKNHFKKNNLRHFCLTFKQSKVEIICLLLFNQLKNCCNLFSNLRIRKSNFYYLFKITLGRFFNCFSTVYIFNTTSAVFHFCWFYEAWQRFWLRHFQFEFFYF